MDYNFAYLGKNLNKYINKDLGNIILSYYGPHINHTEYLEYKNTQIKKYISGDQHIDDNLLNIILSYYNTDIFPDNINIWTLSFKN